MTQPHENNHTNNNVNKSAAVNIRALPAQRDLIDKAASLLNKTRSDFILEAACREAENTLLDQRLFLVDEQQFKVFLELLDTSMDNKDKIQKLLDTKAPWEK